MFEIVAVLNLVIFMIFSQSASIIWIALGELSTTIVVFLARKFLFLDWFYVVSLVMFCPHCHHHCLICDKEDQFCLESHFYILQLQFLLLRAWAALSCINSKILAAVLFLSLGNPWISSKARFHVYYGWELKTTRFHLFLSSFFMVEEMKGTLLFTLIMATSYWELLHDGAFSTYEAIEGQPPHYHVGTWIVSNCRTCHANLQELVGPYQHCLELHSMSPILWRVNIFSRNSGAVCKQATSSSFPRTSSTSLVHSSSTACRNQMHFSNWLSFCCPLGLECRRWRSRCWYHTWFCKFFRLTSWVVGTRSQGRSWLGCYCCSCFLLLVVLIKNVVSYNVRRTKEGTHWFVNHKELEIVRCCWTRSQSL